MPEKKTKPLGAQFSVVRVGWEDAAMTQPLYRLRCQVCGGLFGIEGHQKSLQSHARLHEKKARKWLWNTVPLGADRSGIPLKSRK